MEEYNAYDLRTSNYRYLRGTSEYLEKAESWFGEGSLLVSSGMAGISLALQYYRPNSIWYPKDIYQGTHELIEMLDILYNDENPDLVIIDFPSFTGKYHINPFPDAYVVVDNSVDPCMVPDRYDVLVTSLSKYHTDCRTVLGLVKIFDPKRREEFAELRWKSGYLVLEEQIKKIVPEYVSKGDVWLEGYVNQLRRNAFILHSCLTARGLECYRSGSLVFVVLPDDVDAREVALATPFELRPTYGGKKTFCTYSYCKDNYRYFGNSYRQGNFIRISPGIDFSAEEIALLVCKAYIDVLVR